jgi:alkylation response protein AidB-like acyl-CoA dehydrogenase
MDDELKIATSTLRSLARSRLDDGQVWQRLVEDGWLDLLVNPAADPDHLGLAVAVVREIAGNLRGLAPAACLAAMSCATEAGWSSAPAHQLGLAVDPIPEAGGWALTCLAPVDATHLIAGPLEKCLWVIDLSETSLRHQSRLEVDGTITSRSVDASCLSRLSDDPDLLKRHEAQLALMLAADSLGVVEAALERTCAYVADRTVFGQHLGTFQVVQHRLVDMALVATSISGLLRGAVQATDMQSRVQLAWAAKAFAGERAPAVAEQAIQLHGAMGFTWELGLHFAVRRAQRNRGLLGGQVRATREVIARVDFEELSAVRDWSLEVRDTA